jgi:cytochrome c-type biogenesis protein
MQEVGIITAFIFGAISFVSPCVLPLLPGYLSLMSGYSVADLEAGNASMGRMLRVTMLFVLGFTAVFVAAGASATFIGSWLNRNQRMTELVAGWLIIAFGVLIVALAVSNSPALAFFMRERRVDVKPSRLGAFAPPVMGAAFAFGWTACIGPVLGAILTTAAASESVTQGMVMLFFYSMGLGLPFIAAGLGMTKAFKAIKALRRYLRPINIGSGVLLALFGVLMVTGNIVRISSWITEFFIKIGLDRIANI